MSTDLPPFEAIEIDFEGCNYASVMVQVPQGVANDFWMLEALAAQMGTRLSVSASLSLAPPPPRWRIEYYTQLPHGEPCALLYSDLVTLPSPNLAIALRKSLSARLCEGMSAWIGQVGFAKNGLIQMNTDAASKQGPVR